MKKKILEYILLFIAFVILINLLASNIIKSLEAAYYIDIDKVIQLHLLSSVYIVMMALLFERHSVIRMIANRKVAFRPLFFVGIIILVIGMLPASFYMRIGVYNLQSPFPIGGIGLNVFFAPLFYGSHVQYILTLLGAFTIIRALELKNG